MFEAIGLMKLQSNKVELYTMRFENISYRIYQDCFHFMYSSVECAICFLIHQIY